MASSREASSRLSNVAIRLAAKAYTRHARSASPLQRRNDAIPFRAGLIWEVGENHPEWQNTPEWSLLDDQPRLSGCGKLQQFAVMARVAVGAGSR
jgi:hypothetical protein